MNVKIEIAVKPLVKAYLERNFGAPVILTTESLAGRYFYKILEKQENHRDRDYKGYSDKMVVYIGVDCLYRYGSSITPTSMMDFNNYITDIIYQLMFFSIEMQEEMSQDRFRIKEAIESFLERFNLTEDILSFDTAKKAYYRHRENNSLRI